ncbi:MAG: CoA transferase [Dehalococcoidia bacterium]|nr:CoA transferase [Dehalococcoidia bacterium]
MSSQDNSPLSGIRVLDFTAFVAGPYCTRLMADLGADVIKVEPPHGDLLRAVSPVRDGHSTYFGQLNLGKRSLSIDLKQPKALEAVTQLARKADVLVENFRPGIIDRFGLDYHTLSQHHTDLIYCSISGYGQTGPEAHAPAFAPVIHATSGFDLAMRDYQEGSPAPARGRPVAADVLSSLHALSAINAALFHRERTGQGERIDIALTECIQSLLPFEFQRAQIDEPGPIVPLYAPIETKDGYILVMPVTQKGFEALARALDQEEWITDERFSNAAQRIKNWNELWGAIEHWAIQYSSAECELVLGPSGCPFGRYQTIEEAMANPQIQARDSVVEVSDAAGSFKVPNTPLRLQKAHYGIGSNVPALGQDNRSTLTDWIGMKEKDILELETLGVLHTS